MVTLIDRYSVTSEYDDGNEEQDEMAENVEDHPTND